GSFWYVPADGFTGTDQFTYQLVLKLFIHGQSHEFTSEPATVFITVPPDDLRNTTGVPFEVEHCAPNHGDGNGNGRLDDLEDNVASLPSMTPQGTPGPYVTLQSPQFGPETRLMDVRAVANPSPADTP